MLTLSRHAQKLLDAAWTETTGLPVLVLMEQAALAVTRACETWLDQNRPEQRHVLVLAGKGQNGGDAYACARQLIGKQIQVICCDLFPDTVLPEAAEMNRRAWIGLNQPVLSVKQLLTWPTAGYHSGWHLWAPDFTVPDP